MTSIAAKNNPMTPRRPLQNRVRPDGEIVSVPERGHFMGNRGGRIHRDDQTLGKTRWKSKAWIICLLSYKDMHRPVMGDGYTEVFFLDEATALAAGHRPCFYCQRAAATRFATLWGQGTRMPAPQMDRVLHHQRTSPPLHIEMASANVSGAMIRHDGAMWVVADGVVHKWSHKGYGPAMALPVGEVELLTPLATLKVLQAGYEPVLGPGLDIKTTT